MDELIGAMLANRDLFSEYIGREGVDWDYFFCRAYLYPIGTGLSWHSDGRTGVAGAYVYYAHPQWKAHWGSELLIDGSGFCEFDYPEHKMYDGSTERLGQHLDASETSDAVMEHAAGHYVLPKPNRFVLLRRGVLHRLNPVHPSAGENVRASITGFFIAPDER
ncbi:2OG-Fe(II) oxygenase [Haliangium sp.]|uniref:2OG-Fe(II) oxygenase n=1 Tax=Haliangium sp. TaxID=2663208 RepID=UPI003D0C1EA7